MRHNSFTSSFTKNMGKRHKFIDYDKNFVTMVKPSHVGKTVKYFVIMRFNFKIELSIIP